MTYMQTSSNIDMHENKKTFTGPIVAFAVGLCLIGSLALVQFTPLMPDAFAQQTSTQSSTFGLTGPHLQKVPFQLQNGIPLGPPYGTPHPMYQSTFYALIGGVAIIMAIGVRTVLSVKHPKKIVWGLK
ncbi:MAG: hypothetical protein ACREBB_06945 [Nitrosotalea sp.]